MARDVRVAILGDSRDFSRAVSSANRDAGRLHGTFSKIGSFAKVAALGLGTVAVGAGALAKGFVDAAYESQKVTKQTGAVLKSMGLEAQASADDIAKLSTALSLKTGIDDELIQSGSNVLLTFGELSKQVGKDSKIFERANAAALDMSVALGTDMQSAAMQVGKALNDPVKGLTALRRSGIQFTKQQEDQIKTMVEAGDVAGAQTLMLGELEKQFGGSAAAQATAADKLKVAWGNVQEELGARLIPVVEKVASFLANNLPAAVEKGMSIVRSMTDFIKDNKQVFIALGITIGGALTAAFFAWAGSAAAAAAATIAAAAPVLAIGAALALLAAGIIYAYENWDWFRNAVDKVAAFMTNTLWPALQSVAGWITGTLIPTIGNVIGKFGEWAAKAAEIAGDIKAKIEALISFIRGIPGAVSSAVSGMWESLKNGLDGVISWIMRQIDRALGPLDEILGKLSRLRNGVTIGGSGDFGLTDRFPRSTTSRAQGGIVPGSLGQPMPILAHGGEMVLTHGQQMRSGAGGGNTYEINIATGADPQAVVEAIKRYTRLNGPLPANLVA